MPKKNKHKSNKSKIENNNVNDNTAEEESAATVSVERNAGITSITEGSNDDVSDSDIESDEKHNFLKFTGPNPNVDYPIKVLLCGECGNPIEYCEYYPGYENCLSWLEKNLPEQFEKVCTISNEISGDIENEGIPSSSTSAKKRQTRGGKGKLKVPKKAMAVDPSERLIILTRAPRGKRKYVTCVTGLSTFDVDTKIAAKFLGQKFACGSSVGDGDEIIIQGDVKDELFDILPEKWPQIDEDSIEDRGDQKR